MTFPANTPSPWVTLTSARRSNLFEPTDTSYVFTLSEAGVVATYDVVNDASGEVVVPKTLLGAAVVGISVPQQPYGGYRLRCYGSNGASCGVAPFLVMCPAPHLPANAAPGTPGTVYDPNFSGADTIARSVLDVGPERWSYDPRQETSSTGFTMTQLAADVAQDLSLWGSMDDPARPRSIITQLPNGPYDHVRMDASAAGDQNGPQVYACDLTIDPSTTWVASDDSGNLIVSTGASADALTQVESWPISAPVADGEQRFLNIWDGSAYIRAFTEYQGYQGILANQAPRCLAETQGTNLASVITEMAALAYEAGCTRFEGQNEPPPGQEAFGTQGLPWGPGADAHGGGVQEVVFTQQLLTDAILAGAPDAIVTGPCLVSPCWPSGAQTQPVYPDQGLDAILAWCVANSPTLYPEISSHGYNADNGDPWNADECWSLFADICEGRGWDGDRWMTEMGEFAAVYGVLHTRRQVSWCIRRLIMQEAVAGIPGERSYFDQDHSAGNWSFPAFWQNGDGTCYVLGAATRAWSAARYGTTFSQQLDLGNANDVARAYLFSGGSGDALVLFTAGCPSMTATVNVGPHTAQVFDAFGNPVLTAGGVLDLTISDLPTYVLLDSGTTVTITDVDGLTNATFVSGGTDTTSGTAANIAQVQEGYTNPYRWGGGLGGYGSPWYDETSGGSSLPVTFTRTFSEPTTLDGVLFSALPPWQNCAVPLAFTVEAEVEGEWEELYAYENASPWESYPFVEGEGQSGCTVATYWDEQWKWNCAFSESVQATAVQLVVTALSQGGEPDTTATAAGGQGGTPALLIASLQPYTQGGPVAVVTTGSATLTDAETTTISFTAEDGDNQPESADPITSSTFVLDTALAAIGSLSAASGLTSVFTPNGSGTGTGTVSGVCVSAGNPTGVKWSGTITVTAADVLGAVVVNFSTT